MIMKPVAQIGFIVALLYSIVGAPQGFAQTRALKKINWGVTSLSASNWIPWVAKDAKIYEKNGLDVELILVKGSGQTSTAILGGSLIGAPVALPTVMLADLGGADLVNIAHTVPGVQSKLLVKQEIKQDTIPMSGLLSRKACCCSSLPCALVSSPSCLIIYSPFACL
jgi:ABC-type nitrate/sulfonate/bicarbonate transport system substrate-binding protein